MPSFSLKGLFNSCEQGCGAQGYPQARLKNYLCRKAADVLEVYAASLPAGKCAWRGKVKELQVRAVGLRELSSLTVLKLGLKRELWESFTIYESAKTDNATAGTIEPCLLGWLDRDRNPISM